MAQLGDILKRRKGADGPPNIQLVGTAGTDWVAQNADEFAGPFNISPNVLRRDYGADGEDVPVVDEPHEWEKLRQRPKNWLDDSINAARRAEHEQAASQLTVEESLAAQAAAELALAK